MTRLDHLAIARHHAAHPATWTAELRFDPTERWYRRIVAAPDHEVWLLTWLPGQTTDLHDHGGSAGAFTVVSGELTEERLARERDSPPTLRPRLLGTGRGHRFGPQYIHRVSNRGRLPAISVHVYGPALASMTRYELTDEGLRTAAVEMAGAQW